MPIPVRWGEGGCVLGAQVMGVLDLAAEIVEAFHQMQYLFIYLFIDGSRPLT